MKFPTRVALFYVLVHHFMEESQLLIPASAFSVFPYVVLVERYEEIFISQMCRWKIEFSSLPNIEDFLL